jgi:hypothetical protein
VLGGYKMLSFDDNGWLYPDPLKNITHDIGVVEINDLLKLANEEDCWSAGVREDVKKDWEKIKLT